MTSNPSIFRRAYDAVALVAILNVLALGGLGAALIGSGAVSREKLQFIASVLRGDDGLMGGDDDEDVVEPTEAETVDAVAKSKMDTEIMRLEGERIKAELDQRLALNNSILLRVTTERERFQLERDEAARIAKESLEQRRGDGIQKQISIFEALSPKVAIEHLLAMEDPDEAAKILLQLDTRKAKKIVEAGKRGVDMARMKVILQRVRHVAPERSAELDTEGP